MVEPTHPRRPQQSEPPQGECRGDRLAELKRQVQSGEYESPEKLDLTVGLLLADLRSAAASRGDGTDGGRP